MHKKIIMQFIAILACSIFVNICSAGTPIKYSLTAGVPAINDSGKFYVITKTNNIPLITKDTNKDFYFGVVVESKETKTFSCQSVIKVPSPKTLLINNGTLINKLKNVEHVNAKQSHDKKTTKIASSTAQCTNRFVAVTQFNKGDNVGDYAYEIYLNNELVRTVHFNVYQVR